MMKTNKITLIVMGLALASLFASCKKDNENTDGPVDGKGFVAYTEQGGGNTRTHGVPNGNTIVVNWTENDAILVANQSGEGDTLTYTLTGGYDSTVGTFHSSDEDNSFLTPDYVVIYPAKNAEGTKNLIDVTSDGIIATFTLPATQTYLANSFAEKSMPMVAYSDNQTLQFKNVLGGLCFPMTGGVAVTKIELTSADATESLWGTCATKIGSNGGDPVSVVSNDATGKNIITLDCGEEGVQLGAETPTDFYIMVPAGTLESGFTVTAYNGTDVVFEKSTNSAPGAGFISRNTVRKVDGNLEVVTTPVGAISGFFSVSETKKVWFSQGNLQYIGSAATPYWKFADHQWVYFGTTTGQNSAAENVDRDLFCWGTSGWNSGANVYQPYSISTTNSDYYPGGDYTNNLEGAYAKADWGVFHSAGTEGHGSVIKDNSGKETTASWRTLTSSEWGYLLTTRSASTINETENARYAKAIVNSVIGVIVFPDDYGHPSDVPVPSNINVSEAAFADNSFSDDAWAAMESAGCVFLPMTYFRHGTWMYTTTNVGYYWSTTYSSTEYSRYLFFRDDGVKPQGGGPRYGGIAVRLVCDAN